MPTVLLVEDNDDNRQIYRDILEYAGFSVVLAENGAEGVAAASALLPDVILMDVSMPIMDGLEATRLLKADPATRSIPIIAVTAHAMEGDRETTMQHGFDAYIAKPATPHEILDEVRRWLDMRRAALP